MYLVKRGVSLFFTLLIAVTLIFGMFRLLPGDATQALVDPLASEATRARLAEQFGLDQPLYVQYALFLRDLTQFELGVSFAQRRPVSAIVGPAFLNTLVLVAATFVLAYGLGALLGVVLAAKRGHPLEKVGTFITLVIRGAPTFWIGILAISLFSLTLGWFPVAGMVSPGSRPDSTLRMFLSLDFLHHLALPLAVSTLYAISLPLLLVRSTMLDVLREQYMEFAEAKGLPRWRILYRHGLRNALLPPVTAGAQFIGWAMGGMVVIENVFSWPGLGRTIVTALSTRDFPLAQGSLVLIAVLVVSLNVVTDLLAAYLDPRIELK